MTKDETLLETVAQGVVRIETKVDSLETKVDKNREILNEHSETLDEQTLLLKQVADFDQFRDRLRVIETKLGIDFQQATRQS